MTGGTIEDVRPRAAAGIDLHLVKPPGPRELILSVARTRGDGRLFPTRPRGSPDAGAGGAGAAVATPPGAAAAES